MAQTGRTRVRNFTDLLYLYEETTTLITEQHCREAESTGAEGMGYLSELFSSYLLNKTKQALLGSANHQEQHPKK